MSICEVDLVAVFRRHVTSAKTPRNMRLLAPQFAVS